MNDLKLYREQQNNLLRQHGNLEQLLEEKIQQNKNLKWENQKLKDALN